MFATVAGTVTFGNSVESIGDVKVSRGDYVGALGLLQRKAREYGLPCVVGAVGATAALWHACGPAPKPQPTRGQKNCPPLSPALCTASQLLIFPKRPPWDQNPRFPR